MATPASNPRWLNGILRVEKKLAPTVTEVLHSGRFADVTRTAAKLRRGTGARAERATRRVLHLANLPTSSDLTRLLGEVGRLQNQVLALSVKLDEAKPAKKTAPPLKDSRG